MALASQPALSMPSQLVFGTATRGIELPVLRQILKPTSRVFIAGELGGMGLIRKCIDSGNSSRRSDP
jgi:hypothetical protein